MYALRGVFPPFDCCFQQVFALKPILDSNCLTTLNALDTAINVCSLAKNFSPYSMYVLNLKKIVDIQAHVLDETNTEF
jgi:hypothetical protein